MNKITIQIISIILISFSIFMMLIYLNYLVIGYNFLQYVKFISIYIIITAICIYLLYKTR